MKIIKTTMKRNDTLPSLEVVLLDGEGAAVDLTGATVKFGMAPVTPGATGTTVTDGLAVITNAAAGEVKHDWLATDTAVAWRHRCEFEVTYPGGGVQTFPTDDYLQVDIVEDLT